MTCRPANESWDQRPVTLGAPVGRSQNQALTMWNNLVVSSANANTFVYTAVVG